MITASRDSRKTTRKTGTENTSGAMAWALSRAVCLVLGDRDEDEEDEEESCTTPGFASLTDGRRPETHYSSDSPGGFVWKRV